jgi:L-malate glycosyltransferase
VSTPPKLLHIFSTFNAGGPQVRAAQLFNAWGDTFQHAVVSVTKGELAARDLVQPAVPLSFPDFPDLKSGSLVGRLMAVRDRVRALAPDLVLTYNWGAVEVALARRVFGFAPLVHHEDGFGPDETHGQLGRRIWTRRVALKAAARVIVPSRNLEMIAHKIWWRPAHQVTYVPNGVNVRLFDAPPDPNAIPGFSKRPGEVVVGVVTGLRPEKNPVRLVRLFAAAARGLNARLVIAGTGPERDAILAEAQAQGIADQLVLPGFLRDPHRYMGLFDVYAIPSNTEQFPISLVEAMAARLPVVATDVGDVKSILTGPNQALVLPQADEAGLAGALRQLLTDAALRHSLGAANRARAETDYTLTRMVMTYEALYRDAMRT